MSEKIALSGGDCRFPEAIRALLLSGDRANIGISAHHLDFGIGMLFDKKRELMLYRVAIIVEVYVIVFTFR